MTTSPLALPDWAARALAEERLTQWRWRLKVQPCDGETIKDLGEGYFALVTKDGYRGHSAPVAPGDVLWVREAWLEPQMDGGRLLYAATAKPEDIYPIHRPRPAITMPRWASRWTLAVESVRVGRVAEMTEADAVACGHRPFFNHANPEMFMSPNGDRIPMSPHVDALQSYACEWNARHGPGAWERNDWCAVAVWRAERRNVDG